MNFNFTLEGHVENWTLGQGHELIGKGHAAYQSIRIVDLNTSKVFLSLYLVYQYLMPKKLLVTFHDLRWPQRHEEGSLAASFRFRVSSLPCYPMLESVKNGIRPKEVPFIFLSLTCNGKVANWLDLRSHISKFQDKHFMDTVSRINLWTLRVSRRLFSRRSYDEHSYCFLRWGHLTTWWLDLEWPGSKLL